MEYEITEDRNADGIRKWLDAGLLREVLKRKTYAVYSMAEMYYAVYPYKQYRIDARGYKYCILISKEYLKLILKHGLNVDLLNLKRLSQEKSLVLLSDHNLRRIKHRRDVMNEEGVSCFTENIDYELEKSIKKG